MLTVFANIRINDEDGLQHLKDSFYSFKNISDNWVINVRGNLRLEAIDFLRQQLGNKLTLFELFVGRRNWFRDCLTMVAAVKNNYLLLWNEDHLNIAPQDLYANIVNEMQEQKVDYLLYSWWLDGEHRQLFTDGAGEYHKYIDTIDLTKYFWKKKLAQGYNKGLVTCVGIFEMNFFIKLLKKEQHKFPEAVTTFIFLVMRVLGRLHVRFNRRELFFKIDKLFFYKFTRYTPEGPFNIEKEGYRLDVLPFKIAYPKQELFACLDDDLKNIGIPGYQLIKRGLYPLQGISNFSQEVEVNKIVLEKNDYYALIRVDLVKNKEYSQRYYQDDVRIQTLLKETIILLKGSIILSIGREQRHLLAGQNLSYYPNIRHTIKAVEDSIFMLVSANPQNKKIIFPKD